MQGKEFSKSHSKKQSTELQYYIGIDICKDWMDIFIHPSDKAYRLRNNKSGHKQLAKRLQNLSICLIVMEATGKYSRAPHRALHQNGFAVAVVNPYRSRKFSDVLGQLAKTDKIDAKILALFAERIKPDPTVPPCQEMIELRELINGRKGLVRQRTALGNMLDSSESKQVSKILRAEIKMMDRHIQTLENAAFELIEQTPDLKRRCEILSSIPSIGNITACYLVAELNELGQCDAKEIAALTGLAPMNWDSGPMRGQMRIKGGRHNVRKNLYMSALSARTHNPDLKEFYERLIQRGKKAKVALTAVMRKLIILANALIRDNRLWSAQKSGIVEA